MRTKGQNMPNFAELIFADSMSRGDFAELIFADTKYKRFFHALHIFFSNIKVKLNLPVYKHQTNNKILKYRLPKLKECRKASLS